MKTGSELANEGIDRVTNASPIEDIEAVDFVIKQLAHLPNGFTSDDVWSELAKAKVSPRPNLIGGRFRHWKKRGLIGRFGAHRTSKRPERHGALLFVWTGLHGAIRPGKEASHGEGS